MVYIFSVNCLYHVNLRKLGLHDFTVLSRVNGLHWPCLPWHYKQRHDIVWEGPMAAIFVHFRMNSTTSLHYLWASQRL